MISLLHIRRFSDHNQIEKVFDHEKLAS